MQIPVWHDDQQGTATAILAGLINALKLVNKKLNDVTVTLIGAGAANIAAARLLIRAEVKPGNMILVDRVGILNSYREDMDRMMFENKWKYELALQTNSENRTGGIEEAMRGVDVVIATSTPGPGVIKKEWVAKMNKDPVVFALANPVPEIWPHEAKEGGAKVVATGRSDFPNQVNNSLVFPAVFRGVLDVRGRTITDDMAVAAARALAAYAEEKGLNEDYILPTMEETGAYIRTAVAVGEKAMELGLARVSRTREELQASAAKAITSSKAKYEALVKAGLIEV
ncbi:hypothetical protein HS1genome_1251 [Sulfodiicoccus acidiphilus]|nr:hypothetical protein HS1genome_1251 [Sulfodiicoccus acidiphilus]